MMRWSALGRFVADLRPQILRKQTNLAVPNLDSLGVRLHPIKPLSNPIKTLFNVIKPYQNPIKTPLNPIKTLSTP